MGPVTAEDSRSTAGSLPDVCLPTFEGPLDLLLHLVRAGRMDIFDLPIAALCDQYLAVLRRMEEWDLGVAGEFLVMAATLLEIKSRMLLPRPPREVSEDDAEAGIDPRAELALRLAEYARYQGMADLLQGKEGDRSRLHFRDTSPLLPEFRTPAKFGEMRPEDLLRALERLLADVGAGERAITSVRRRKVSLRITMRLVAQAAEQSGWDGVLLQDLFPEPPFELLELVLLFLALLELLRLGSIRVVQDDFCGGIRVFHIPESERASENEAAEAAE